ncbi:MAG TPA: Spy/CpxP family protein refolding chaperone, partial [Labilithrix sp.]|nr:Spy/CpxP family protein refolding chaperone [Labilithrix sp.]
RLVRLISATSALALATVAVPTVARADHEPMHEKKGETSHKGKESRGKVFEAALADVDLRPDQKKAIDELKAEMEERHAPVKSAKRELMLAAADQIEKGAVDACELDSEIEAVAEAKAKARPGDREAFEELHSILDEDQRARFVTSLKRHWDAFQRSHSPTTMAEKLARKLDLSGEQKDKVESILKGLDEIREATHTEKRERWAKMLDAFKGDEFELDKIAPTGDVKTKTTKAIESHLWATDMIVSVLNEDQRGKLADYIRDKAKGRESTAKSEAYGMSPSDD